MLKSTNGVFLVLLASATMAAALPTLWLQNDLIGNHFAPHSELNKAQRPAHHGFPAFAVEHPKPATAAAAAAELPHHHQQQQQPHHQQPPQADWWKAYMNEHDNNNNAHVVEDSRHVRSQFSELDSVNPLHLKAGSDLDLDLMMDYTDLLHDGPELSPEDQEFLLNQLAEGLALQTKLENLIKQNHELHSANQRNRRSPGSN